jgi:putative ABC transport system permease protein
MHTILQDLRYAARQLWKSPGFTIAAVLTLTIGIGANTAIFSSMDAVVLHPLAVPQLDHVVTVTEVKDHGDDGWAMLPSVALANYVDWQQQSRSFEDLAARTTLDMSLTGAGDAAHVRTAQTSANFFRVLRTPAVVGRVFGESECQPGHDAVAVLSYGFWERRFGGDPAVLGRKIELDQREYTVIGVMPKTMQYPSDADIYLPLAPTPQQLANRSARDFNVTGRLRDGVTVKQAQAELGILAGHLAASYPTTNLGRSIKVEPLLAGINGPYTPLYYRLVLGASLFVLLVVCANVANLQFARGIARRPEIAMRTALGASRSRIMRQLLTENLLLGLIGAVGGVVFGYAYGRVILMTMPERVARYMAGWDNTSLNGRVLAFSLLLALGAGLVSGIAPAIGSLRLNLVDQLKSGARGTTGPGRKNRLRTIFAVSQIALAVALVIGAALISKGMYSLLHLADSFEPTKMLTWHVVLPLTHYDTPQKQAAWYRDSLAKLRALPGVTHAEVTSALPYSDNGWVQDLVIDSRPVAPDKFQTATRLPVSAGYFSALRIPILSGRGFTQSDSLDSLPVAVVSQRFVQSYFPGENPLGRRVRMGGSASKEPWLTIVGVAQETSYATWTDSTLPAVYMPVAQLPPGGITYAVMTNGDPLALAPAARKALASLDPTLPLDTVMSYAEYLHELLLGLIYAAGSLVFDALIALLLAAIGIFAVMANQVGERSREIGVRLAMGARREDVLGMILRRASWITGIGVCSGLVMAYGLAHLVANLLRGVRPDDVGVFASITGTIVLVAMAASWLPARRASRIDPMVALRDE